MGHLPIGGGELPSTGIPAFHCINKTITVQDGVAIAVKTERGADNAYIRHPKQGIENNLNASQIKHMIHHNILI